MLSTKPKYERQNCSCVMSLQKQNQAQVTAFHLHISNLKPNLSFYDKQCCFPTTRDYLTTAMQLWNEYVHKSCEAGFENNNLTPSQHLRPQNSNSHPTPLPYPISPNSNNCSSNINDFVRYLLVVSLWQQAYCSLMTNLRITEPGNVLFRLQLLI